MGIKSFLASRKNQQKANADERITVNDYMSTKLITFKSDDLIEKVIDTLIKYRISGGPVVNDNYELVGIISETDCIRQISQSRYHNLPIEQNTVGSCMAENVDTIDGNMNIFDAATKFIETKRRRFPIVENGKLVGQISQKDILKAAIALKSHTWK